MKSLAFVALFAVAGCGSSGLGGSGGEGGMGGVFDPGECRTHFDCEPSYTCIAADGHDGPIPNEVEDGVSGLCEELRWADLSFGEASPGRNTEEGFIVEPGDYLTVWSYRTFGESYETAGTVPLRMPFTVSGDIRIRYGLEYRVRAVAEAFEDFAFDVECNLVFDDRGELLEGGVTVEPGLLVCPTNEPGSPGMQFEFNLLD